MDNVSNVISANDDNDDGGDDEDGDDDGDDDDGYGDDDGDDDGDYDGVMMIKMTMMIMIIMMMMALNMVMVMLLNMMIMKTPLLSTMIIIIIDHNKDNVNDINDDGDSKLKNTQMYLPYRKKVQRVTKGR